MARAKKVEEVIADQSVEEVVAELNSVTVVWRGNSRTYTRKIHGDDFRALAEEFATKNRGELV